MSRPRKIVTGAVLVVGVLTVAFGLSLPDDDLQAPNVVTRATPTPVEPSESTPAPTDGPDADEPADDGPTTQAVAPASVRGVWPGRPAGAEVSGESVDWCGAVVAEPTARARQTTSAESADAAACRAVSFLLDARYSRLSLPRERYSTDDFAAASAFLSDRARDRTYPGRVQDVVSSPRSVSARRGTGLLLLDGPGAGEGREFFGAAFSAAGYADRAVWVDPRISSVEIDGSTSGTLVATVEVSAAVPVWNPETSSAEQMRIPTTARLSLVGGGTTWSIDSWTLETGPPTFEPIHRG